MLCREEDISGNLRLQQCLKEGEQLECISPSCSAVGPCWAVCLFSACATTPVRRLYVKQKRKEDHHDSVEVREEEDMSRHRLHICSVNNFPTAAGLASSAAGYACLGRQGVGKWVGKWVGQVGGTSGWDRWVGQVGGADGWNKWVGQECRDGRKLH